MRFFYSYVILFHIYLCQKIVTVRPYRQVCCVCVSRNTVTGIFKILSQGQLLVLCHVVFALWAVQSLLMQRFWLSFLDSLLIWGGFAHLGVCIWWFWAAFGRALWVPAGRASSSPLASCSRGKDMVVWRMPPWKGRCDIIFSLSSSHVAASSCQGLAKGHWGLSLFPGGWDIQQLAI